MEIESVSYTLESTILRKQLQPLDQKYFFHAFINAGKVAEDEADFLLEDENRCDSLTVSGMDDCIAILGIEYLNEAIVCVSAYHVKSHTSENELIEQYFKQCSPENICDFFIVGGNDASTKKGGLLDTITTTISKKIEENQTWVYKTFPNLKKGTAFKYTAVNIQKNGTITYCLHN